MTNMQYMYINSAHLITHLQSVYLLQDYFQHSKALKKKKPQITTRKMSFLPPKTLSAKALGNQNSILHSNKLYNSRYQEVNP